jgi:hypothetical protein
MVSIAHLGHRDFPMTKMCEVIDRHQGPARMVPPRNPAALNERDFLPTRRLFELAGRNNDSCDEHNQKNE